jgi:hypothetical protein
MKTHMGRGCKTPRTLIFFTVKRLQIFVFIYKTSIILNHTHLVSLHLNKVCETDLVNFKVSF